MRLISEIYDTLMKTMQRENKRLLWYQVWDDKSIYPEQAIYKQLSYPKKDSVLQDKKDSSFDFLNKNMLYKIPDFLKQTQQNMIYPFVYQSAAHFQKEFMSGHDINSIQKLYKILPISYLQGKTISQNNSFSPNQKIKNFNQSMESFVKNNSWGNGSDYQENHRWNFGETLFQQIKQPNPVKKEGPISPVNRNFLQYSLWKNEEDDKNTDDIKLLPKEDLYDVRSYANRQAINRFSTAEIKVDMSGMQNHVDSDVGIDGIIDALTEQIACSLASCAEGVHI